MQTGVEWSGVVCSESCAVGAPVDMAGVSWAAVLRRGGGRSWRWIE
jgi:hypothetical protein